MKIALIGYGKMGKEIEKIALSRGHHVVLKATASSKATPEALHQSRAEVAIEFSRPDAVLNNMSICFNAGIPVVVGTTGWYDQLAVMREICKQKNGTFFYASNFSIGVNILFEINRKLAAIMNAHDEYEITIEEIHHSHKLDSPSGTAITLAKDILGNVDRKERWVDVDPENNDENIHHPSDLMIKSMRLGEVVGTHIVKYKSKIDQVELRHEAYNRSGFAAGAVTAAEWLEDRKGCYTMRDLLNFHVDA